MSPPEMRERAPTRARTASAFGRSLLARSIPGRHWLLLAAAACHDPPTSSPQRSRPPDGGASTSEAPPEAADTTGGAARDAEPNDGGSGCPLVYRSGHGDLYVDHSEESGPSLWLRSELEPGAGELLYEPHELCIVVPRSAFEATSDFGGRPVGDQWEFLGVTSQQPFWYLPQEPRAGVPWLGLAAKAISFELPASEGFTLSARDVEVPAGGVFSIWISDIFGEPIPLLSTRDGPWQLHIAAGAHEHVNWGFSAAGRYDISFHIEGAATDGGAPETASASFRFEVQP